MSTNDLEDFRTAALKLLEVLSHNPVDEGEFITALDAAITEKRTVDLNEVMRQLRIAGVRI